MTVMTFVYATKFPCHCVLMISMFYSNLNAMWYNSINLYVIFICRCKTMYSLTSIEMKTFYSHYLWQETWKRDIPGPCRSRGWTSRWRNWTVIQNNQTTALYYSTSNRPKTVTKEWTSDNGTMQCPISVYQDLPFRHYCSNFYEDVFTKM